MHPSIPSRTPHRLPVDIRSGIWGDHLHLSSITNTCILLIVLPASPTSHTHHPRSQSVTVMRPGPERSCVLGSMGGGIYWHAVGMWGGCEGNDRATKGTKGVLVVHVFISMNDLSLDYAKMVYSTSSVLSLASAVHHPITHLHRHPTSIFDHCYAISRIPSRECYFYLIGVRVDDPKTPCTISVLRNTSPVHFI